MCGIAGVEIAQAAYGLGLFASGWFEPGDVVGQVQGAVIDDPDYSSDYCIDLGDCLSLEPAAPFRYLNHSCEPNCVIYIIEDDEEETPRGESPVVLVEATRRIRPGDELTIDYAWPADAAIPCGCSSRRCRGWIVSDEELPYLQLGRMAVSSCA